MPARLTAVAWLLFDINGSFPNNVLRNYIVNFTNFYHFFASRPKSNPQALRLRYRLGF